MTEEEGLIEFSFVVSLHDVAHQLYSIRIVIGKGVRKTVVALDQLRHVPVVEVGVVDYCQFAAVVTHKGEFYLRSQFLLLLEFLSLLLHCHCLFFVTLLLFLLHELGSELSALEVVVGKRIVLNDHGRHL